MAVDVSKIPNNNKFDPVRKAILQLQDDITSTGASVGTGTVTVQKATGSNITINTASSTSFGLNDSNNSTITIGLDDSGYYSSSGGTISGDVSITGSLTITSNLTVNGDTIYLNTQTIEVEDNIIELNRTQADPDTATATTSGIQIYRGDGVTSASFIFDDADDTWDLTDNLAVAGNVTGNNLAISNWNTAYSYTELGHLRLSVGGTITGNVTVEGDFTADGDITLKHSSTDNSVDGITITNEDGDGLGNPYTGVLSVETGNKLTWNGSALLTSATGNFVTIAGDQTITGDKTFSSNPSVENGSPSFTFKDTTNNDEDAFGQIIWRNSDDTSIGVVGFYAGDARLQINAEGENTYIHDSLEVGTSVIASSFTSSNAIFKASGGGGNTQITIENAGSAGASILEFDSDLTSSVIQSNEALAIKTENTAGDAFVTAMTIHNSTQYINIPNRLAIGKTTAPSTQLDISGGILASGNITTNAGGFYGNGSGLTNVNATTLDSIDSTGFIRDLGDVNVTNFDTLSDGWLGSNETTATNQPYANHHNTFTISNDASTERKTQMFFGDSSVFYFRTKQGSTTGWHDWEKVYTDVNLTNVSQLTNDSGYLTGNQTITLSGDVSGSGTTSISVSVNDDSHNHSQLVVDTISDEDNAIPSNSRFKVYNSTSGTTGGNDGTIISSKWSSGYYCSQIFVDVDPTGYMAFRGKNSATWGAWNTIIHDNNYTSYITKSYIDGLNVDADTIDGLDSSKFFRKDQDMIFDRASTRQLVFHSDVNYGSDRAFLYFNENSSFHRTGTENVRFSIGAFNDFANSSVHSDAVDIQGGSRLYLNAGSWDTELNTAIGTPATGSYLDTEPIQFAINNAKIASITTSGFQTNSGKYYKANGSDVATLFLSGNASATGTPDQFVIKHNYGGVDIGNYRGSLNFTSSSTFTNNVTVNGRIQAKTFLTVKGTSNSVISEYNTPTSTSVNLGTYLNDYAFIDLASTNGNGSWIDFSYGNGGDYRGRIRHQNSTEQMKFYVNGSGSETLNINTAGILVNGNSTISGNIKVSSYLSATGTSDYMGAIGFNREASTGTIYNTSYGAYQIHNFQGEFQMQVYNSAGTQQGVHRFKSDGNVSLYGNLAVGTTSLSGTNRVEIQATNSYDLSTGGNDTGGILIRGGATTGDGSYTGGIGFGHGTGTVGLAGVQESGDSDFLGIAFFTHPTGTGNAASEEKMRLTAAGNLGIGTATPNHKLDCNGDANINGYLNVQSSYGIQSTGWVHLNRYKTNSKVAIGRSGTNVSLIVPNGFGGFGNEEPQEALHVSNGVGIFNVSDNWQQSTYKTNLFRGGKFETAIGAETNTLKIFPATYIGRTVGSYWGGISFMHLDPEYSTWGTSYTGAQMWIGGKLIDTAGQERSAFVIATNNGTTAGTHPTERVRVLPNGSTEVLSNLSTGGAWSAAQGVFQCFGDMTINRGSIIRWANGSGGTGEYIYSKTSSPYDVTIHSGAHDALQCPNTGSVRINYQGSQKFVTTSSGVSITGTMTASADVVAYSDERLKENVKTIDGALDKVKALRGVTYNRKDTDDKSEKIGVIAQEIQKVLPQVVQEQEDGMLGVSYGNIVGVLIEAIKEQQEQIDELKRRLDERS